MHTIEVDVTQVGKHPERFQRIDNTRSEVIDHNAKMVVDGKIGELIDLIGGGIIEGVGTDAPVSTRARTVVVH